jgi:hypothetical protein
MVPPHPKAADSAPHKAAVEVLALRLRSRPAIASTALTRAVVGGRTGRYGLELLFGYEAGCAGSSDQIQVSGGFSRLPAVFLALRFHT